jgi:hypothetical protein
VTCDLIAPIIVAAIAAIGLSVGAAFGAWWKTNRTQNATEATLLIQMRREYTRPHMTRDLDTLRGWAEQKGSDFTREWSVAWDRGVEEARVVDDARRRVAAYFETAFALYNSKMISRTTLRTIAGVSGLHAVRDYVLPLSREIGADLAPFQELFQLCELDTIPVPIRSRFGSPRDPKGQDRPNRAIARPHEEI